MKPQINRLLLATALIGTFFVGTAGRIFNISMPTVARDLDTDLLGISWALLAFQLSSVGLSIIFGRVGDFWGREKIFALGFAVFSVTSLLCGLAHSLHQLVAFRLLEGVGAAMIQSSGRALAAEAVPEAMAGRAQGFMTTAHHTGFLLGPVFGGFMIDFLSWRWAFFSLVPLSLAGAALTLPSLKRQRPTGPRLAVDYVGALLVFVVMATLLLALDRRTLALFGAGTKILLGGGFAAALAGLIAHERRTPHPFIDLALFRRRKFSTAAVSLLIVATCYVLTSFVMPFYLQDILGLAPSMIGVLFIVPAALTVVLAPLSGWLADRFGARVPTTIGIGFLATGCLIGAFLRPDSHWILPTLLIACHGVTNGIFNPANSADMIGALPKEHRGFASSVNYVAFGLGNVLGIGLAGLAMSVAFARYTGIAGAAPTAANPAAFAAAINATLLAGLAVSGVGILTSVTRGAKRKTTPPVYD
ncbi:MAG TPA: MFS transporter [Candidatus Binatia bacterium]|jgi:EmrB/QacA subfamily drug resistance transporter